MTVIGSAEAWRYSPRFHLQKSLGSVYRRFRRLFQKEFFSEKKMGNPHEEQDTDLSYT